MDEVVLLACVQYACELTTYGNVPTENHPPSFHWLIYQTRPRRSAFNMIHRVFNMHHWPLKYKAVAVQAVVCEPHGQALGSCFLLGCTVCPTTALRGSIEYVLMTCSPEPPVALILMLIHSSSQ